MYSLRKQKTNTLTQIVHFPFSRVPEASGREPEAYRKAYLLLFCLAAVPEAPGRFPEGLPEAYWELLFYVGSGRFPEGFRKTVRKGKNHLVSQAGQCKQSDLGQSAEKHSL